MRERVRKVSRVSGKILVWCVPCILCARAARQVDFILMASHQLFHQLLRLDSPIIHLLTIIHTITKQVTLFIVQIGLFFISLGERERERAAASEIALKPMKSWFLGRVRKKGWFISTRTSRSARWSYVTA